MAETGIHLTSGFHGSADEQIHLHIDQIDRSTLEEEEYVSDTKNEKASNADKNTAQIINIEDSEIEIFPNPTTGIFTISVENSPFFKGGKGDLKISITDLTGNLYIWKKNKEISWLLT